MSRFGESISMITKHLYLDKILYPTEFCNRYGINRRRLKDYICIIRNSLADNDIYYIQIEYKRSQGVYVCIINE